MIYIKKYLLPSASPTFIAAYLFLFFAIWGCSSNSEEKKNNPHNIKIKEDHSYKRAMAIGHIQSNEIDEASGLVVYRGRPNFLWTHNDSWDEARIFLIQKNGRLRAQYHLEGAENRDWEDLAAGPGPEPDTDYLYIGDIGDNFTLYSDYAIYRLKQPAIPTGPDKDQQTETVSGVDKLSFAYPDGSHDAETLFIDPLTKDLYIVTKEETQDRVYRYPYPQSTSITDTVEFVSELPFNQFTGGDLSPDGQTLLLKTLKRIFIWRQKHNQSISDMLTEKPKELLPYGTGPQEEAIAFGPNGRGYYTLSESKGKPVKLYFHPPKSKNKN